MSIQSTCGKGNFALFSFKVEKQLSVASVALQSVAVDRLLVHVWTSFIISDLYIHPLKMKRRPLYLKPQSVPHSKHFSSWL